jgi:hypothetical protein
VDLILKNKYKIQILSESITLKEAIDGIAYTLSISLIETNELKNIGIAKGDSIELFDKAYDNRQYIQIFSGVIWDISKNKKSKKITITGKERTVVVEESEDEYLWSDGQTASQRTKIICNDWGIPIGNIIETGTGLAKDKRKESLYGMIKKDLKETAQKGGNLYKLRMNTSLDIIKLGSNETIYKLDNIIEELEEKDSLDGAVTQVKVLGKEDTKKKGRKSKSDSSSSSDEKELVLSPIIGIFKKDTETYGALQKIIDDDKVDDYAKAQAKANCLFSSGETSKSLKCCKDINILRAGDNVSVYGETFIITEITHNLGSGEKMNLTVMKIEDVRRKFYSE